MELRDGKGSATLLQWDESDLYIDIAAEVVEQLELRYDDLAFLNNLRNGGEKGAGLRVLKKALQAARSKQQVLVVFVKSEAGDQNRLRDWYLKSGLLVQVPKRNGNRMANILIDKEAPLTLRTKDPDEDDLF
jgi:hypothetical protein